MVSGANFNSHPKIRFHGMRAVKGVKKSLMAYLSNSLVSRPVLVGGNLDVNLCDNERHVCACD